jgi:hypothetical protein
MRRQVRLTSYSHKSQSTNVKFEVLPTGYSGDYLMCRARICCGKSEDMSAKPTALRC